MKPTIYSTKIRTTIICCLGLTGTISIGLNQPKPSFATVPQQAQAVTNTRLDRAIAYERQDTQALVRQGASKVQSGQFELACGVDF
ncbi:MAG: hypothetical protein HC778_04100, partial [Chamaesiphon sp. CSU_1_12]|nr:hypothetical protein [Chamaesiphon sp. CSU_1_12]